MISGLNILNKLISINISRKNFTQNFLLLFEFLSQNLELSKGQTNSGNVALPIDDLDLFWNFPKFLGMQRLILKILVRIILIC